MNNQYKLRKFICLGCGNNVEARRAKNNTKYCSVSCHIKFNNPFLGKKHSLETKGKMKQKMEQRISNGEIIGFQKGHKDIVPSGSRKKQGIKMSKFWKDNPEKLKETSLKISRKLTNRKLSPEHILKLKMVDRSHTRAEKSYNWKGGITPINNQIRGSLEYKLWSDSVWNRDSNFCQKCGCNFISKLVAHHILNFSSYIELRFAIDNGITFCRNCHKDFHKIYGKKNNTREQLQEFLNN